MKHYGLIGYPLGHSFSADFFSDLFAREGIDAVYTPYPLESIDELESLLREVPLVGLNVTSPYKRDVLRYATQLSPEVRAIGAANVLRIERSNQGDIQSIIAHNTDIEGFGATLRGRCSSDTLALVLGTGGAAEAVRYALGEFGIRVLFVSRHSQRADAISYEELAQYVPQAQLIVNATPVGLHDNALVPFPYELLTPQHLCYDLIYNPSVTPFLAQAGKFGAQTMNGLAMLYGQARAAWCIWNK